jgi:hypothetical protein
MFEIIFLDDQLLGKISTNKNDNLSLSGKVFFNILMLNKIF